MPDEGNEPNGLNTEIFLTAACSAIDVVTAIASYYFGLESQRSEHPFAIVFVGPSLWLLSTWYILSIVWDRFERYWKISLVFGILVEYLCYHLSQDEPPWPFFLPLSLTAGTILGFGLRDFIVGLWAIISEYITNLLDAISMFGDLLKAIVTSTVLVIAQFIDLISQYCFDSHPRENN